MTDQAARYDRIAAGYDRWWAPVLAPSAVALLDRLDGAVAAGARDILDVGVGTGNLSIAALRRWPEVRVAGIDASREMLGAAEAIVAERVPEARDRFEGRVAFGARVTVEDEDGRRTSYALVGPDEVDLAARQISIASPVAQALLGKRAGERVVLRRPKGDGEVTVVSVALTTDNEIGA